MMVDLFAHSPDAVMVVRTYQNKRFLYASNAAFYTMTGYTSEQLIGLELPTLPFDGPNPLWPIVESLCASITLDNPEAFAESYFTLPNQMSLLGELYAKNLHDTNEAYTMIVIRDRSEHKWIEDTAYECNPILSMLLTTAGSIVSLRSYRGPVSYDRLALSLTDSVQFIAQKDRGRVRDRLKELQYSKETGEFNFTVQLPLEMYHIHSLVKPFYNGDGSFRCYAILVLAMEAVHTADEIDASQPPAESINENTGSEPPDSSYKLRLLMLEKRLSVTRLAENTQISLTTISNIRNGKIKKPQRLTAQLIANELGVSPSEIWSSYK